MNAKLKIALLSILGFSTAACCGNKKVSDEDNNGDKQPVSADSVDTQIMLMYGVPFPEGSEVAPIDDAEAMKRMEQIRVEEEGSEATDKELTPNRGPAPFPDGKLVVPVDEPAAAEKEVEANHGPALRGDGKAATALSEEEAAKRIEEMKSNEAAEEQSTTEASDKEIEANHGPALRGDGKAATALSEEEAAKRIEEMRAAEDNK